MQNTRFLPEDGNCEEEEEEEEDSLTAAGGWTLVKEEEAGIENSRKYSIM